MTREDDTLARAEVAFGRFVELFRKGQLSGSAAFVEKQEADIRDELRQMIEEFSALRERIGQGTLEQTEGRVLGGYRLLSELGRGGMSVVWEAEEIALNRRVALKVLAPHQLLSPTALQRFEREARAGGRLAHAGIVPTYGAGEADGVHYIVQELVPGGYTLSDSFNDLRELRELPGDYYKGVAQLFLELARALQYAHNEGVIHRDVKPGNVLISEDNEPRIVDFGLARIQDELSTSRTIEISGTPFYMSPEQAAAKAMGIDERTDQFSLGATLYEGLTLKRPFEGDTSLQVFRNILTVDPPDPRTVRSRVPVDLAVICMKMLEKNPDQRYVKIGDAGADLERFLTDRPIVAKPPGALDRASKWARRHRTLVAALAVGIVAFVIITALLLQNRSARILAENTTKDLEAAQEELLAFQSELLAAQEDMITNAVDLGQTRTYPSTFGDMSLDLVRTYIARGELEEAADWLRAAPIPETQIAELRRDTGLAPLLEAGYDDVFQRKALPGSMDHKVMPEDPADHAPDFIEELGDGLRVAREWVIPGSFRGVAYDDDNGLLFGLTLGGEAHIFDRELHRLRSFLLASGTIELRLARLGVGKNVATIGFGSTAHRKLKACFEHRSLWTYYAGGRINDVRPCDLDGDGTHEILLAVGAARGIEVLGADGTARRFDAKLYGPYAVSPCDFDGDGVTDVAVSAAGGSIRVFDQMGVKKGRFARDLTPMCMLPCGAGGENGMFVWAKTQSMKEGLLVRLAPDGSESFRISHKDSRNTYANAFCVGPEERWAAVARSDYSKGSNNVTIFDLEKRSAFAVLEYYRTDAARSASPSKAETVLQPPTTVDKLKNNSGNPAGASQLAWIPAENGSPPTLIVATKLGLRAYSIHPQQD